jgi:hypothetical protein
MTRMALNIIYISGEGRSGSTLLDRILGTLEGVASFNEIYELWEHGFLEGGRCACGRAIRDCPFWAEVSREVTERHGSPEQLLELQDDVDHSRHFFKIWTGLHGATFRRKLGDYKAVLSTLYHAIARHAGAQIIVDSSKLPSRALILSQIPGFKVYVIHIVRDVRGVIYSWNKLKWDPSTGGYLRRYRPYRSIAAWAARNALTEMLAKRMFYMRLNYEDWVRRPRGALQEAVNALAPTAGKTLPFESEDEIRLGPIHSVRGNPDRFVTGPAKVRLDDAWMHKLDKGTERMARILAYPMLARYGYLRGSPSGRRSEAHPRE